MNKNQYFARASIDEIGPLLVAEVEKYYRFLLASGLFNRMYDCHLNYHGISPRTSANSHGISRGGKSGQLSMMKVNHFRNLGQHLLQLTTSQKPAPQPIATNTDAKTQEQVVIAKGILEYYSRDKRVDRILRTAAEHAVVYSEGYVLTEWSSSLGDEIGKTENGGVIKNGDIECSNILPCDIVRDSSKDSHRELDWTIVRRWKNKYEVAAKYAINREDAINGNETGDEVVNAILASDAKSIYDRTRLGLSYGGWRSGLLEDSLDIPVFEFYHKKSNAVPGGRKVVFIQDGTVLYDGPLGVNGVPVRRISPGELVGSPYGYTPMFDLLVIQEAIDALYSAVTTNQITFGVQLIMAMKGGDIDFKQLARGLSFIEYATPDNKPEALNLTHTPAEIFAFIKQLEQCMETISGVNATVRGNPETSLKSGSALALVQSQSIQFSSGLQHSYAQLTEDVFTDMLNNFKSFANDMRTITVVGKHNRSMIKSFNKDSISEVNRVVVDVAPAITQVAGGRMDMANNLLQAGMVKRPEEYIAVYTTGKLDPMIEGDMSELINIRSENEALADGQPVFALPIDPHSLHIREHRCVAASPEVRNNPEIVRVLSDHILEHVGFLGDPMLANLMMVIGEQPLMNAMMPIEQQNGGTPPKGGGEPQTNVEINEEPTQPKADYPTNPQTGEEWNPEDGGV